MIWSIFCVLSDGEIGLDPGRFRVSGGGDSPAFATLDSQMSDTERFKDCQPFFIRCRGCKGEGEFRPIWERDVSTTAE